MAAACPRSRLGEPRRTQAYDGDTVCANVVYTQESIDEIDRYFQTRQAHVDPKGGMRNSMQIDNVKLVMHNMTSNVEA